MMMVLPHGNACMCKVANPKTARCWEAPFMRIASTIFAKHPLRANWVGWGVYLPLKRLDYRNIKLNLFTNTGSAYWSTESDKSREHMYIM